jgi:hypothetical protein
VNKKRKDKEDKEEAAENGGGGDVEIEGLDAEKEDETDDTED